MPPKRDPKAPAVAPSAVATKKAPRPATTKKKRASVNPAVATKMSAAVTKHLTSLLYDRVAVPQTIVDFIVGPSCGLETIHKYQYHNNITPLLMAVKSCRLDVVQLLLSEHSPNTNAVDASGLTALHFAAANGNPEMVRCLVERDGSLINSPSNNGSTPLHCSLYDALGSATALLLLDLGADPHASNYAWRTPLHLACEKGFVDVASSLFAKGAHVDPGTGSRMTPLYFAVLHRHSSLALLLLEAGADPNISVLESPLHVACTRGMLDMAKALLAKGASVDACDYDGNTPLHSSLSYVHCSCLPLLLLEAGANPNIANNNQQTPLHLACRKGFVDVVRSLLASGAAANACDHSGETPLDLAIDSKQPKIVALLKEASLSNGHSFSAVLA